MTTVCYEVEHALDGVVRQNEIARRSFMSKTSTTQVRAINGLAEARRTNNALTHDAVLLTRRANNSPCRIHLYQSGDWEVSMMRRRGLRLGRSLSRSSSRYSAQREGSGVVLFYEDFSVYESEIPWSFVSSPSHLELMEVLR
ncbi:hypothetical protein V3C99_002530 [Haemonchus contortus]